MMGMDTWNPYSTNGLLENYGCFLIENVLDATSS